MLQRFRDRFGTAGLVIAVIALVTALGGTALAASSALRGKQKKEVEKIAKKYAGVNGANGTNGANGSNGKEGPQGKEGPGGKAGTDGDDGTNGTSVTSTAIATGANECEERGGSKFQVGSGPVTRACNGKNGETGFTETLPSNMTETGAWVFPQSSSGYVKYPISFNIPLASVLSGATCTEQNLEGSPPHLPATCRVHYIGASGEEVIENFEGEPREISPSSQCSGSSANPTAEQGSFCMYALTESHLAGLTNGFRSPGNAEFGTGTTGVMANFLTTGVGPGGYGTWAVTAP